MSVIVCNSPSSMGELTASFLSIMIKTKPDLVLGLPTGQTPIPVYQQMKRMYKAGALDCSEVITFNLDEYYMRGKGDPDSYYEFMRQELFQYIPFKNSFLPNGKREDVSSVCYEYDTLIQSYGGIDVQVLGIGSNGHIAFNEPSDEWTNGTSYVKLTQQTISDNAKKFYNGVEEDVPKNAYSMGMKQILKAGVIILIATGTSKAEAIKASISGPITPKVPASLLQTHDNVFWILDKEAASLL